ncbi:hypothetical protein F885_03009 [Acinetobacter higginsii]|nr:hypothetical protein [Acinetobacter higginsii]ENX58641.1 hypothetical protein F885_03009 [Acinetobacter higginsii]
MTEFKERVSAKQELKFTFYVGYGLGFFTGACAVLLVLIFSGYF